MKQEANEIREYRYILSNILQCFCPVTNETFFLLKTFNTDTMTIAAMLAFNDKPFEGQQVEQALILGCTLYILSP